MSILGRSRWGNRADKCWPVGLLGALVLAGVAGCQRKAAPPEPAPAAAPAPPADAARPIPTTPISMLAGSDTRAFLTEMAATFGKQHPEFEINLTFAGSVEAANRIVEGRQNPLIFAPSDSRIIDLLKAGAQEKQLGVLFDEQGEGAPRPLFSSPLVLVAWEDRAAVLEKAGGGTVSWKTLRKAIAAPKGWAQLGGDAAWGTVKLAQSDPRQSNGGLQALVSMAIEHKGGKRPLVAADLTDKARVGFIAEIEKAVPAFPVSTEAVTVAMLKQGPAQHDVAVLYESSAIHLLAGATRRWGKLRVYYPSPSLLSDHPVALIRSANMGDKERTGALAWLAFLRSPAAQSRALAHGFRPSDPGVPVTTADAKNPFFRLRDTGLKTTLPAAAVVPDAATLHKLIEVWTTFAPK